ncbi:class II aldolase/adducin family protein [Streptomyces californicus]
MLEALRDRTGCLLANHGTVTYGDTLDQAYERTAQLEWLCRLRLTASSVPGRARRCSTRGGWPRWRRALKGYGQSG